VGGLTPRDGGRSKGDALRPNARPLLFC